MNTSESEQKAARVAAAIVAEARHERIAAIMVDYCPADQKDRPVVEKMGATILALHDALKK
jgi:hypothetical protein